MNNIYAVFDSCSGLFGDPLIASNDATAKRIFEFTLSQPDLPKFVRDDSVLYGIGYFDKNTGTFAPDCHPYIVCRGSSLSVTSNSDSYVYHEPEVVSSSCPDGNLYPNEVDDHA